MWTASGPRPWSPRTASPRDAVALLGWYGRPAAPTGPPVLNPRLDQTRDRGDGERSDDDGEREPDRDLRRPLDRLAPVDERHVVRVQGREHELDADEPENGGQADRQVGQPAEQSAEQEVQLA